MKILYAIQGTGNGHIARSLSLIQELKKSVELDILVSGSNHEVDLPLPIKYNFKGLGFAYGKKGSYDVIKTIRGINLRSFFTEINCLPIHEYSTVISDFEPISVRSASNANIPVIGLSNQSAILDPSIKKPHSLLSFSKFILWYYARCKFNIGLHYQSLGQYIETPIISKELRMASVSDNGYGLVYLPFYSDQLIYNFINDCSDIEWVVFSKQTKYPYKKNGISFEPIDTKFTLYLTNCHIVLTGAGFATTTEALFLGKRLVVLPMKSQYEQLFNSFNLEKMGIEVIRCSVINEIRRKIKDCIKHIEPIKVNFPDNVSNIAKKVFEIQNAIL